MGSVSPSARSALDRLHRSLAPSNARCYNNGYMVFGQIAEISKFARILKEHLFDFAIFGIIYLGATIHGRRLALSGGTVTLRSHRNPKGNLKKGGRVIC